MGGYRSEMAKPPGSVQWRMGICAIAPVYGVVFLALVVAGVGEGAIEGGQGRLDPLNP